MTPPKFNYRLNLEEHDSHDLHKQSIEDEMIRRAEEEEPYFYDDSIPWQQPSQPRDRIDNE